MQASLGCLKANFHEYAESKRASRYDVLQKSEIIAGYRRTVLGYNWKKYYFLISLFLLSPFRLFSKI